jgi:hypothetical protein
MHRNIRNVLIALGVAVLVLPAAVSEGHERDQHGPPASVLEKKAQKKSERKAKHGAKKVQYVFKGTFHLADSSVTVLKGNKHVRRAGLVGETVVFDLSAARIVVADNNGDGKRDAADLQDGDKVVVQARLPRSEPGAGPFAARKLVDQTHKKAEGDDESEGEKKPEGSDD